MVLVIVSDEGENAGRGKPFDQTLGTACQNTGEAQASSAAEPCDTWVTAHKLTT